MTDNNIKTDMSRIGMTSVIVTAYVSNNHVAQAEVPRLLAIVHAALADLSIRSPAAPVEAIVERPTAPQIRKSIGTDRIVSFIDGRSYKTLKRHLTANGLTPATYCERYGLPADYPMVATAYSEQRSRLAKATGLGVPGARAEEGLQTRRRAA